MALSGFGRQPHPTTAAKNRAPKGGVEPQEGAEVRHFKLELACERLSERVSPPQMG